MGWTRSFAVFCLLVTGAVAVALKRPRRLDSKALEAMRGNCPAGQIEWYNGGCALLMYTEDDHTAAGADAACQSNDGMHLPSVHSAAESIWIRDRMKKLGWISVVIGLVPGECRWFDQTDFDFDYMESGKKCSDQGVMFAIKGDGHWSEFGEEYVLDDFVCTTTNYNPPPPTSAPASTPHYTSSCGQTPVKPNLFTERIVGGQTAVPYSWPWQVVLCTTAWGGGCPLDCGGTVVDNGWIMTAGHCVYGDLNPKNYQVKAAIYKQDSTDESGEQIAKVKAIYLHPNYDVLTESYDMALLQLATPLQYSDHVQPICLPTDDSAVIAKSNSAYVTGWGKTTEERAESIQLRQIQVPFVDYSTCEKEYPGKIVEKSMLCAGAEGGDSGGPMVVQGASGTWFQVGIVSWGNGCGDKHEPGIYSRVSAFCDFISGTTSGKVSCQTMA